MTNGSTANIDAARPLSAQNAGLGGARASSLSWTRDADLLLLLGLLVATEVFGRAFSVIGVADTLFVTEVLLLATIAALAVRLGPASALKLLRRRVPLGLLLVFWVAGAIATVRGLQGWGISLVTEDVGLFEYSLLLPLTVLVVRDRSRFETFSRALLVGAVVCSVLFLGTMILLRVGGGEFLVGVASGMYISFFVAWVAASFAHGLRPRALYIALAVFGLLMMWVTDQRSVWVAILVIAAVVLLLSPLRLVPVLVIVGALFITGAAAYALETAFPLPPGATAQEGDGGPGNPQVARELSAITGGGGSAEGENVTWRLAYWEELTRRTFSDPSSAAVGIGFGEPGRFVWNGRKYDFRDGDPGTGSDVAGPHNSFIAVLHRMGLPAMLSLVALAGLALWRVKPLLFGAGRLDPVRRANVVAIVAALGSTAAVAGFNEALKGPYLGMFFWVAIGLLYAISAIERNDGTDPAAV